MNEFILCYSAYFGTTNRATQHKCKYNNSSFCCHDNHWITQNTITLIKLTIQIDWNILIKTIESKVCFAHLYGITTFH